MIITIQGRFLSKRVAGSDLRFRATCLIYLHPHPGIQPLRHMCNCWNLLFLSYTFHLKTFCFIFDTSVNWPFFLKIVIYLLFPLDFLQMMDDTLSWYLVLLWSEKVIISSTETIWLWRIGGKCAIPCLNGVSTFRQDCQISRRLQTGILHIVSRFFLHPLKAP